MNINKIANEIEKDKLLKSYWDYQDRLTDEQIIKIIIEEDGLNDIENELYDYNIDYISNEIREYIKEYFDEKGLNFEEFEETEDYEELRMDLEGKYNFDINDLINNSQSNIRVTLQSNEDMIYYKDWEHTNTIKEFRRRFKHHFKIADLKTEFNELMNDYALITFYFNVKGQDILILREQILKGYITLRKGLEFGLFNSWVGGGSVLEIPLLKSITLNLKDWRFKNKKEEIIENLKEYTDYGYYSVNIEADEISKYGLQQVYGLSGWQNF